MSFLNDALPHASSRSSSFNDEFHLLKTSVIAKGHPGAIWEHPKPEGPTGIIEEELDTMPLWPSRVPLTSLTGNQQGPWSISEISHWYNTFPNNFCVSDHILTSVGFLGTLPFTASRPVIISQSHQTQCCCLWDPCLHCSLSSFQLPKSQHTARRRTRQTSVNSRCPVSTWPLLQLSNPSICLIHSLALSLQRLFQTFLFSNSSSSCSTLSE